MSSEALLKSPVGSAEARSLRESNTRFSQTRSVPAPLSSSFLNHSSCLPFSSPASGSLPGSLPPTGFLASSWKSRNSHSESELSLSRLSSSTNSTSTQSPNHTSRSFASSVHAESEAPFYSSGSDLSSFSRSGSFFSKQRIVAPPSFNRWLVAPAVFAVHLSIGQVYAFSVFNDSLSMLLGLTHADADDWKHTEINWIFSTTIIVLGLSGVVLGPWIERVGPRLAIFVAAICFGSGFFISALGVYVHQIWLLYLGYGFLGGVGIGIGYISPVSTLFRWFPDRPGMAAGIAIMGFGGGAALATPLSLALMNIFQTSADLGVGFTFIALGIMYLWLIMFGALLIRTPPHGWESFYSYASVPAGVDVHANRALRTPQFWLLWFVLVVNVSAGIGILLEAFSMIQEMFPNTTTPKFSAVFVIILSLSNMLGRFVWASLSDVMGRKLTFGVFLGLGSILYAVAPSAADLDDPWVFVCVAIGIASMYGGGFATLPAYVRDLFGVMHVVTIHGRLLSAWSVAGVAGPSLLSYLRQNQIDQGVPKSESYYLYMYILASALGVGFFVNLMIRPVASVHHFVR